MKSRIALCLTVLVLTSFAGCGGSNDAPPAPAATVRSNGTTQRINDGAAIDNPVAKRPYRIGVLFPFLASPFWINEAYGVLDQAQKLGVTVVWLSADGYDNIDKQASQMEDLVSQRVDAILLGATSSTGMAPAVDRATAAGIPVFAHVTSSTSKSIVSAVLDDDLEIGRKQGSFMGAALSGRGTVAMLNGPAAAEWSSQRVEGFKQALSSQYPSIKIVAERFGIPDRPDAQRLTEDLLASNSSLNGLFTVADGMAMGAVDAVRQARRIDQVVVTTASFSREAVPYMRAGHIKLNVDENPVLMGRVAVNNVVQALNGEPVPAVIYIPNPAMTAESLDRLDAGKQWAPENWRIK